MDTSEQTAPLMPTATRSAARRWIRTVTISLNLLAAVLALVVSTIGVALTMGIPDIHLPNDESEISGIFSIVAISGFIGLFCALPVLLGINILNWILSARARRRTSQAPEPIRCWAEDPPMPHTLGA